MIEVKMNDPAGVILTTAGQKCNQNIKVVPGFDIPEEYDGAYELLVPTVSGVWMFNETLDNENISMYPSTTNINFVSNGEAFDRVWFDGGLELKYNDTIVYSYGSWTNEAYRTIDFGTEPQEVSEEFLAWFTVIAVKQ